MWWFQTSQQVVLNPKELISTRTAAADGFSALRIFQLYCQNLCLHVGFTNVRNSLWSF